MLDSTKYVLEKAKPLKDVQLEPFNPRQYQEPKVNTPSNVDPIDPMALLDLLFPLKIYITVAENTNLYATAHNVLIVATPTNRSQ